MINSKWKGAEGEREVSKLIRSFNFGARRGQQYAGGASAPDVVSDLDGFHIEVKRVQNLQLYKALEQATADSKKEDIPVVFHRRNKERWVVILDAEDFLSILSDYAYD